MRDAFHTTDALAERLSGLCARYPAVEPEMVAEVLRAVLDTLGGQLSGRETTLLREVETLGRTIAAARAEIAVLRVEDTPVGHIGAAGSELAAVVSHTAAATDAILDACEALDDEAGRWPRETATALQAATTQIYEACSFQDITGQRLTKVVGTLRTVEARVEQLMAAFSEPRWAGRPGNAGFTGGAELLNGPQLPGAALAQAEIDAILFC